MTIDVNNPYFRTKVLTASPEELRLMLIEGSIRFMRAAREGLVEKNYEKSFTNFTNTKNIIMELMNTLRHDIAPELCTRLDALYTFMFTTLTYASMERDVSKVDTVIELMEFERETWLLLMEQRAEHRGAGDETPGPTPQAAPLKPATARDNYGPAGAPASRPSQALSVQG